MKNYTFEKDRARVSERDAERLMAREVAQVLGHHAHEKLYWKGTIVDLMEALHTAYLTNLITGDDGLPLSFAHLAQLACAVLHVPMPSNPYETAARGHRRKGRLSLTFAERYRHRLAVCQQPLHEFIGS